MAGFFKALLASIVTFLIFFGVPVLVYSFFQRVLGMVPPSQLMQTTVYKLASLKGAEALILVIIFLLVVSRKRGKEGRYAFFLGFLLFLQAGIIPEYWFYMTLQSPKLYAIAGVCSAFISYFLSSLFLAKFYKTTSSMILPD